MLKHKKIFLFILAFSFILNVLYANPVIADTVSFQQKATKVIEDWLEQLEDEKDFTAFQSASWQINALGPGTHSHLVTFYENEKKEVIVGYMVLHSAPTGALYIGEYGKGHFDSLNVVSQRPSSITYYQPFEFIFTKDNEYLDPFTTENLPISKQFKQPKKLVHKHPLYEEAQLNQQSSFDQAINTPYFSPYDSLVWLYSKPINEALETDRAIDSELELGNELYYRTKSWQSKITTVYAITALHKWNTNQFYIGLQLDDEDSIRFVPYLQLLELGHFYSSSDEL